MHKLLLFPFFACIVSCTLIDMKTDKDHGLTALNPEEIYASDRLSYRYKNEILNKDKNNITKKNTVTRHKTIKRKSDDFELFKAWKNQKKRKSEDYQSFKEWQEFQDWLDYKQSKKTEK